MKYINSLFLLLLSCGWLLAQQQIPHQNFISGGAATGSAHTQSSIPTHFAVIGQPMVVPLFVGGSSGTGILVSNQAMFSGSITDANILSFSFAEQNKQETIDDENFTVSAEVVFGTNVSSLTPTIVVSPGASISPASNSVQDFTNPVIYTVTAADGETTQDWTVTVSIAPNTETDFLTFFIPGQVGGSVIDKNNHTISVLIPYGSNLSSLIPTFTLSEKATARISGTIQQSGINSVNFTNSVVYTVTADDGITIQDWAVTVNYAKNTATDMLAFSVPIQSDQAIIDNDSHTINLRVPFGTNLSNLVATFSLSFGATAKVGTINQISSVTANNFNNQVTYSITAEDGISNQDWIVSITAPNTETNIISYSFPQQTKSPEINNVNRSIAIEVTGGTNTNALVASFALSSGATARVNNIIQVSGSTPNNFSTNVSYVIRAEDGITTNNWTISVSVANIPPSAIFLSNNKIPFVNQAGTIVGELTTEDGDINDNHTYQILSGSESFSTTENKNLILVKALAVGNYNVTIESSDGIDAYSTSFSIEVSGANPANKISFGKSTKDFRIISMPFQSVKVNAVFTELLASTYGEKWKILNYNGTPIYQDYNLTSDLLAGKGYWFLSTESTSMTVPMGSPVRLNSKQEFELSLIAGWNMIGNPFLKELNVAQIINYNVSEGYFDLSDIANTGNIFKYQNGNYDVASVLDVYEGAWIKTTKSLILHIPSPTASSSGRIEFTNEESVYHSSFFINSGEWQSLITLQSGSVISTISGIGMHPEASMDIDFYDIEMPPAPGDVSQLFLNETRFGLAKSIVNSSNGYDWQFELRGNERETLISWDRNVINNLSEPLYLLIADQNQFIDMKKTSSFSIVHSKSNLISFIYGDGRNKTGIFTNVYPNPTEGVINLEILDLMKSGNSNSYTFELFSLDGSSIFKTSLPPNHKLYQIDIEELSINKGLYLYKITSLNISTPFQKLIIK